MFLTFALASFALSACSTSGSQERADDAPEHDAPAEADANPTDEHTTRTFAYRHATLELPEGFSATLDESGLWANSGEEGSGCEGTRVELTYVVTHLDADETEVLGDGCQTRRTLKTLEVPGELPTRARLICETQGPFENENSPNVCDAIVDAFVLAEAPDDVELAALEAPKVRERVSPGIMNEPGEHEVFVPGDVRWSPMIYVATVDLGLPSEVLVVGSDRITSGVFLLLYLNDNQNAEGTFVENELDYVESLWAEEISENAAGPADLFAQVRDENDEGPTQRCVRYTFSEGYYRLSLEDCPEEEARGRMIFSY